MTAHDTLFADTYLQEGYTAVAVAAFYGHVYAVEIFLENGAHTCMFTYILGCSHGVVATASLSR